MPPSRNQPCPCGSGAKYKKCCAAGPPAEPRRSAPRGDAAPALRDVARWRALRAQHLPGEPVHPLDDPRRVGALLGLWPPRRGLHRPPSVGDYDRLIAALAPGGRDGPARPAGGEDVWLDGDRLVIAIPRYDDELVAAVKRLPERRFDAARRAWTLPATAANARPVALLLDAHRSLAVTDDVLEWLRVSAPFRATAGVWTRDGAPVFVLVVRGGSPPAALAEAAAPWHTGWWTLPLTGAAAEVLQRLDGVVLDGLARAAAAALRSGDEVPGARLTHLRDGDGEPWLALDVGWAANAREAFLGLPEVVRVPVEPADVLFAGQAERLVVPADPALLPAVDAFLAQVPAVGVEPGAAEALDRLRAEHERAEAMIALSQAKAAEIALPPLGGTLEPFQRAGVAYVLAQRTAFLADEQGLGKTVQALAALEADGAFPAVVVCPSSVKLNWQAEARRWLPERSVAVLHGRAAAAPDDADVVVLNYDVLDAHAERLAARRPRAVVFDESHYCKEPRARRTQAALRLAAGVRPGGLKLALTGTPILNRPKELTAQLRLLDRLGELGSGARLGRRFAGADGLERLHWHLRARCYVRRTKAEVLTQLPPKRVVTVPVGLTNEAEYRLAERDVVAWLQTLPLDLRTLEARVAAALRNERLVRLNHLRRLAARGKLAGALRWIDDFLASGEPLVVFAEHVEVQRAVLERHPDALHVLGEDATSARDAAVRAFQASGGPPLIVCSLRAAAHGITLTRASNVAFLELDWTPARHDQAEDRCHRMGQSGSVTAWYLLAPQTLDATIAALLHDKRAVIGAVTDGRAASGASLVDAVARELRARATAAGDEGKAAA